MRPLNPSTFSAMGYAHAMIGNTLEAVDCFHKALGLRRDDTFSTTMLNYVIEQLVDDTQPFQGQLTEIIPFVLYFMVSVFVHECHFVTGAPEKIPVFKSKKPASSRVHRIISYDDHNPDDTSMNIDDDSDNVAPVSSDTPNVSELPNITAGSSALSFEVEMTDTSSQTLDQTT